jgi:hypothetical protein
LEQSKTEIHSAEFLFAPPPEFGVSWRATFYKFDAIRTAIDLASTDDVIVLLDSDVIMNRKLELKDFNWSSNDLLCYKIDYRLDQDINGLTRKRIHEICTAFGLPLDSAPEVFGGEFIAFRAAIGHAVLREIEDTWTACTAAAIKGDPHFLTEEHMLAYIAAKGNLRVGSAEAIIKRIHTYANYSTGVPEDLDIPLWHLPAEKHFGFPRLFSKLESVQPGSDSEKRLFQQMGQIFGVPNRTGFAKLELLAAKSKIKLLKTLLKI